MERVAPSGLHAFGAAVELPAAERQDVEGDAVLPASVLEIFLEFGAAIDLDGPNGERSRLDESLSRKRAAAMPAAPAGVAIKGREVLAGLARQQRE